MENDDTTDTTDTTGTPAPIVNNDDAAPQTPVTPPVEPPAAPAVPDGYVKAEDVEAERTARAAAETAQAEAETRAAAAESRARTAEINAVAQKLGFNDPADAALYVGADVTDIEAALASVIEAKPYLKKAVEIVTPPVTPTNPANPARVEAVTREQLKGMTAAQVAALDKSVVSAALMS